MRGMGRLTALVLVALATALMWTASAHAAGATRSVSVPDRGDVTVAVAQVKIKSARRGKRIRGRVRPPRVVIANRAALPRDYVSVARAVRLRGKRNRFAVGVVQVFRNKGAGGAAPRKLVVKLHRPRGQRGVRYTFKGRTRVARNISEELVASARTGTAPAVRFSLLAARRAQLDVPALIRAIVCPILHALANGPLGGLIRPVVNALRVAFGCTSSDPNYADVASSEGLKGGSASTPAAGQPPAAPPPPPPQPPPLVFADWTSVSGSPATATGTLGATTVSLSGTAVDPPPSSVLDGTSTVFNRPEFTPPLASSDSIHFRGATGNAYTLQFGSTKADPVLHLGSLASTLRFPPGTAISRLSGDAEFSVAGSDVTGALDDTPPGDDANGTVRLSGSFSSIPFSTDFAGTDGIYLQVGAR